MPSRRSEESLFRAGSTRAFSLYAALLSALWCICPPCSFPDEPSPGGDVRLRVYRTQRQARTADEAGDIPDSDSFLTLRLQSELDAMPAETLRFFLQLREDSRVDQAKRDDEHRLDVSQGFLEFQNVALSPVSIRLGRQTIHAGEGLIMSANESDWIHQGMLLTYDALPVTVDLAYAEVASLSPDTGIDHFGWVYMQSEYARAVLRDVALYAGVFTLRDEGAPVLAGFRSTVFASRTWTLSAELGHEFGDNSEGEELSAFITDLLLRRTGRSTLAALRWTYASGGDGRQSSDTFQEIFHHEDWGRALSPSLSNIHVLSARMSFAPIQRLSLGVQGFWYMQEEAVEGAVSTGCFDGGGYLFPANGRDRDLGRACDAFVSYDAGEHLAVELSGGFFFAGDAFDGVDGAGDAHSLRIQCTASF